MSIQALPQSTVRALGATQALTDPASLVKELLDNALDANANSVAISISTNTLDVIHVRDNGHGITPQDRPLVARRYCTSKITDDGDLKDIGGSSLGFRGEALASAAELSGSMVISTRIEGEQVATSLIISQKGDVINQERASLPVGTTVKITDFIKANPVRRQVALKNVDACLKKIKRLLQAYAFARPHVRLSLQVLKAKNKKSDWVYAPKPNGNAEDAAFKIVGAACASSCLWSVVEDHGLTLQAFLPRPDADVSKISNIGSFVSIDARPVSTARGLLKQITKVFRESLKSANSKFEGVKEPFMFLEVSGGSYDANLEPAKDDVLFENADIVLDVVKQLFGAVYKPMVPPVAEEPALVPAVNAVAAQGTEETFTPLEDELPTITSNAAMVSGDARRGATEDWLESLDEQQSVRRPSTSAHMRKTPARSNVYGVDEDDVSPYDVRPATGLTEADFAEIRSSRNDPTLSNPWVLAKMNTSTRDPILDDPRSFRSPARRDLSATSGAQESSPTRQQHNAGASGLPTPRPSSPSPPLENGHPSNHASGFRNARGSRLFEMPEQPLQRGYSPVLSTGPRNIDDSNLNSPQHPPDYPYMLDQNASESARGTRLRDIPDATIRPRRAPAPRPNKPFVPPSKDHTQREQVWFDPPESARKPRTQRTRQPNIDSLVSQGEVDDPQEDVRPLTPPRRNRDIRDFVDRDASSRNASDLVSSMIERRNFMQTPQQAGPTHEDCLEVAEGSMQPAAQNRGFVRASELVDLEENLPDIEKHPQRMPKRRKTTDRNALQELSPNLPMEAAEAEDEAAYQPAPARRAPPSRRRSSKGLNRTKSSRLPLERVPAGQETHQLIFSVSTDTEQLRGLAGNIDRDISFLSYQEPVREPTGVFDTMDDSDLQSLTASLHNLLVTAGSETDVVDPAALLEEIRAAVYAQRESDSDSEMLMSPE